MPPREERHTTVWSLSLVNRPSVRCGPGTSPRAAMCVRNVDVHVSCSSHGNAQLAAFFIDPRAKGSTEVVCIFFIFEAFKPPPSRHEPQRAGAVPTSVCSCDIFIIFRRNYEREDQQLQFFFYSAARRASSKPF